MFTISHSLTAGLYRQTGIAKPRFGNDDNKKTELIGQGQILPPTAVDIKKGKLGLIRKEESTANLKRDVWTVEDTTTGQKYSIFLDGSEDDLVALYAELAKMGEGTAVRVTGIAHKPSPRQRLPFLYTETIQKI